MKDFDSLAIVYRAIDVINEEFSLSIGKNPDTQLFGSKGTLDSIGLVNFITIIEELVEKETGKYITVANEAAMLETSSPFKSVASLVKHVSALVKESNA